MNRAGHINHWRRSANKTWITTKILFEKKRYDHCLFFCHLTVEKYLKGLYVQHTGEDAPKTHNLVALVRRAHIPVSEEDELWLELVNEFNISGRYDEEKDLLYKKATHAFTKKHFMRTGQFILWLKKHFSKKTR